MSVVECTDSDTSSVLLKELEGKSSKYSLSIELKNQLDQLPEVKTFIQFLQKCIVKQKKKLASYKKQLQVKTKSISTQTEYEGSIEVKPTVKKSVTDEITEAAQQALTTNGFIYEETSGLYYDYNSGYYYNAEYGLYYDGNTGIYMKYNQTTKEYEFHSQVTPAKPLTTDKPVTKKDKKKKRVKKLEDHEDESAEKKCKQSDDNDELEDGECSDCTDSTSSTEESNDDLDLTTQWPPCMRIIVEETSISSIKQGSLFILTFEGGTIGREGKPEILLAEVNNSKHHAKIAFDKEEDAYFITDLGSRNGTFLNGKRLSPAKVESDAKEIVHGSKLQIGSTILLCHIHAGTQTCGHCEPGLFRAKEPVVVDDLPKNEVSQSSKLQDRKLQLKHLRKKFGLSQNDAGKISPGTGYTDRAEKRRVTVGSQNPHEKTQTASLNEAIASDNKGFKLLSRMGWKEGEALGKDSQGRLEPIELLSNPGASGLGSIKLTDSVLQGQQNTLTKSLTNKLNSKTNFWLKTRERYDQISEDPKVDKIFDLSLEK